MLILSQFNKFVQTEAMRLSKSEIEIIKSVSAEVWGIKTTIYLFGSRVDDSQKGGDIDLYVHLDEEPAPRKIMLQKAKFLAELDLLLGEQKIDLLVSTNSNKQLPIIKTALKTGVPL